MGGIWISAATIATANAHKGQERRDWGCCLRQLNLQSSQLIVNRQTVLLPPSGLSPQSMFNRLRMASTSAVMSRRLPRVS